MILDAFDIVLPDPIDEPNDIPENPHLKVIRRRMLHMPVDFPGEYETDPTPEKPWVLYEYRFNSVGHIYDVIGVFHTEQEALKAGSDYIDHAAKFAETYHGKFIGLETYDGKTYSCFAFQNPLDIIGFSFYVEQFS